MSMLCDCVKCGGTNAYLICENDLTDAFVEAHRPRHLFAFARGTMIRDVTFTAGIAILLMLMFAGELAK